MMMEDGMVAGGASDTCLPSTSGYILTLRIAACSSDIRHLSTASCQWCTVLAVRPKGSHLAHGDR